MYSIGLKVWGHDTGAAMVADRGGGLEIVAISEARLNREKHSGAFPLLSIQYCLEAFGLRSLDEVDCVIIDSLHSHARAASRLALAQSGQKVVIGGASRTNLHDLAIENAVRWPEGKTHWINHIDAHAASTYFMSPFDEAAILSVDAGFGLYHGTGNGFSVIDRIGYFGRAYRDQAILTEDGGHPKGISKIYSLTTDLLGFSYFGAGKTMGLAAFSDLFPPVDRFNFPERGLRDPFVDHGAFINARRSELTDLLALNED
jgi:carbamoyltransferase